jgi:hypothetical protein
MSDYLWDKTGELEEDVEQLEQLLGTLRYEPRPLKLPEDFGARNVARNSFRPQRPFAWQRLALAASLLLTLLAGAWLVAKLNQRAVQRESAHQNNNAPASSTTSTNDKAPQHDVASVNNVNAEPVPTPTQKSVIVPVNYRHTSRVSRRGSANVKRNAPPALTGQPHELIARDTQPHIDANAQMTPEQREATEKLLLALRITSAKLNYAQREMQEASARKPETR